MNFIIDNEELLKNIVGNKKYERRKSDNGK